MPTVDRVAVGNLPLELTSFVGRAREIGEVKELLSESRLVTLAGVGGAGKTRLALRVAAELGLAFSDGAWFVDLTQLQDPGLFMLEVENPDVLAYLVGATLGVRDLATGAPLQRLVEQLEGRRMLIVLDNCEHLIPASAIVARTLLLGCPEVRILATSRDPLGIGGETVFAVPPLPVPVPGQRLGPARLGRCESVALFLARAQASMHDFQLTAANDVAVAELCHRLEGLPLAIELAAARIRVLTPREILDRLTDRFALLRHGSRAAPERQQTLRGCVDWSFDLCSKPERMLWARLSVFVGGFELDAVQGICADDALPGEDHLDLVAALVDRSILNRDDVRERYAERARYGMLETIRDYGQGKLIDAGERAAMRRRHRDWYSQLTERAKAEWVSDRQVYWMARLRREHANLRTAIEYCLTEPGEAEAALRIGTTLPIHYWWTRGLFGEGRRWLDRALDQVTTPSRLRARALLINSQLAFGQGDAEAGARLLEEGEGLARDLDAAGELGHAAFIQGLAALFTNDLPVALETLKRAWRLLSREPQPDFDLNMTLLITLGVAAALTGDWEWSAICEREMSAIVEAGRGEHHRSAPLWVGGLMDWVQGDLPQAAARERECLRLKLPLLSDDKYGAALTLETLAWITADMLQYQRSATLLGAAEALRTELGAPITSLQHFVGHHDACERRVRAALGDPAFADAFGRGQTLTLEDVLAYALDEQDCS